MTTPTEHELELLRRELVSMGAPAAPTPEEFGLTLPDAGDLIPRGKPVAQAQARAKRKRLAVGLIAAAVVAVIAAVVPTLHRPQAVAQTPPILRYEFANARNIAWAPGKSASGVLEQLAAAADRTAGGTEDDDTTDVSDQTQYLRIEAWWATLNQGVNAHLVPMTRESWLRPDDIVQTRETSGRAIGVDGRDAPQLEARPKVSIETVAGIGADAVRDLPDSQAGLRDRWLKPGQCNAEPESAQAACLVDGVTNAYYAYVVPPRTAARFWRVLAQNSEFRSLGRVVDRAGRTGVGIAYDAEWPGQSLRNILIISPDTGALLGTEQIALRSDPEIGLKAPAIFQYDAILESRYTKDRGPIPNQKVVK